MKLNFTANKRQGQSTLRAVVDFFFPYTQRIRIEAKSTAHFNSKGIYKIDREFYTFRAFFWHYVLTLPYWFKRFLWEYKNALDFLLRQDQFYWQKGAIAFDTTTNSGAYTNATSVSWSHTCTGSNLVLGVGSPYYEFTTSNNTCTATYNSVSMTNQADIIVGTTPTYRSVLFSLANPATGANTVALTFVGGAYGAAGACSFSGCNTTTPIDTTGTNTGASVTSINKTITTANANSFIMDCLKGANTNTSLAVSGTGQVMRWDVLGSNTNINAGSTMPTTTAGNYTPGWTWSTAQDVAYTVMAINEATGVVKKVRPTLLTLKVG